MVFIRNIVSYKSNYGAYITCTYTNGGLAAYSGGKVPSRFPRGRRIAEHIMTIKVTHRGKAGNVKTFACFVDLQ